MRADTKQHFQFSVSFVFSPSPNMTTNLTLAFQQRLAAPEVGIVFDQVQRMPGGPAVAQVFARLNPALQVTVAQPGPAPVGQLTIVAPQPNQLTDDFMNDAEAVVEAFRETWPGPIQTLRRDCTVQNLYAVTAEHAFQYLWERRLHQPEAAVQEFGRPILGGGLRFVMPARPDVEDEPLIEVKIESLLRDPRMLYVETQAVWERPSSAEPSPRQLLQTVIEYADGPVVQFITRED
jgi:hypothetical protein